jgi:F-type H+-transporting ATPase subunit delta
MSSQRKSAALARQLFGLSLEQGRLSPERVTAVLQWVEKNQPESPSAVLRAFKRLIEAEVTRSQVVIEYAGEVSPTLFAEITASMTRHYARPLEAVTIPRPELIAGLRVRVGCDIYENTVVSQLTSLKPVS